MSVIMECNNVFVALNSGCVDGEDVICPESVLNVLISHGWVIPIEQQVSRTNAISVYCAGLVQVLEILERVLEICSGMFQENVNE